LRALKENKEVYVEEEDDVNMMAKNVMGDGSSIT
jgi:hypothetical protein